MSLELKQLSCLEKVFLNGNLPSREYSKATVLQNEEFAYQIAYKITPHKLIFDIKLDSPISECIELFEVQNIPSEMPAYLPPEPQDDNYITRDAGLFPDALIPTDGSVTVTNRYHAIWINIKTDKNTKPGKYPIKITFENLERQICESSVFYLEVLEFVLPPQRLIFTQWFHADCIATYYGDKIFSRSHWTHIENFIKTASRHGINMILTPIFTLALDTMVGHERPTVQLVDVFLNDGKYSFGFSRLKKWIRLCQKHGIKYFEMSHLFTQWGAAYTPKIVANVNGTEKRIFGWDKSATCDEYKEFLAAFLPCLTDFLRQEGIADVTYFHISDEPNNEQIGNYKAALEIAAPHLEGFKIIDALSKIEFYNQGIVKNPIPAINKNQSFLGMENLWGYYCCGQHYKVSNRFFAMPSARTGIIGLQLYKFNVKGFLQWGYNFYYSQLSIHPIDPYKVSDGDGAFPSGDAFSVYPSADGYALPSLRLKVFLHALQDIRALEALEERLGRQAVIDLVDSHGKITFEEYPKDAEFLLELREKINLLLADK